MSYATINYGKYRITIINKIDSPRGTPTNYFIKTVKNTELRKDYVKREGYVYRHTYKTEVAQEEIQDELQ